MPFLNISSGIYLPTPVRRWATSGSSTCTPNVASLLRPASLSLSEEPHDMDEGSDYYFLVGLLGSQADGVRSFVTCYGFTEILPGRITVDRSIDRWKVLFQPGDRRVWREDGIQIRNIRL